MTDSFNKDYTGLNPSVQIIIDENFLKRKKSYKKSDASLSKIILNNSFNSKQELSQQDKNPPKELTGNLKSKIERIINTKKAYSQVKYNNTIYSVGDFITVTDQEDYSVCKLTKVIPFNLSNKESPSYWPSIEVQWYYRKKDINKERNGLNNSKKFASISEYEVFKTDHRDIIFIESIIGKCYVYTLEEYEALDNLKENVFFSRAAYDESKRLLNPPIDKWEKSCKCNLPLNPDQLYIKCEKCEKWYHPECSNIKEESIENTYFICYKCQ